MKNEELVVSSLQSFQKWGEWIAGLDLGALVAAAFVFGFSEGLPAGPLPCLALLALFFFGLSTLFATLLVGNIPAMVVKAATIEPKDLLREPLVPVGPLSLRLVTSIAGNAFAAGAVCLAVAMILEGS